MNLVFLKDSQQKFLSTNITYYMSYVNMYTQSHTKTHKISRNCDISIMLLIDYRFAAQVLLLYYQYVFIHCVYRTHQPNQYMYATYTHRFSVHPQSFHSLICSVSFAFCAYYMYKIVYNFMKIILLIFALFVLLFTVLLSLFSSTIPFPSIIVIRQW